MKKIQIVWIGAILIFLLTGCSNYTKKYDKNTLIVKGNGSLMELSIENFKDADVSSENIASYIEEEIDDFNDKHGAKIKEKKLDAKDLKHVKLLLSYKDMKSYNNFNGLDYVLEDYKDVKESKLTGKFQSGNQEKVKVEDFEKVKKAKVLMISEPIQVVVKGDVLYYNDAVSMKEDILTTNGKDVAIIIFK